MSYITPGEKAQGSFAAFFAAGFTASWKGASERVDEMVLRRGQV